MVLLFHLTSRLFQATDLLPSRQTGAWQSCSAMAVLAETLTRPAPPWLPCNKVEPLLLEALSLAVSGCYLLTCFEGVNYSAYLGGSSQGFPRGAPGLTGWESLLWDLRQVTSPLRTLLFLSPK